MSDDDYVHSTEAEQTKQHMGHKAERVFWNVHSYRGEGLTELANLLVKSPLQKPVEPLHASTTAQP